jgi:hypothetical protein
MAFAATTEWDVRTTGSDANGGGFDTATAGTDYSQQDAPEVVYTDLVIDAVSNTKITSAATPFTAAHVGNIINVTGGTGFTVQRVQITSVDGSNVATCDKAVGTTGSTGGTGSLGGALATLATAMTLGDGYVVHIKAGDYSTAVSLGGANRHIIGYGTAHYDYGTKPIITLTDTGYLFYTDFINGRFRLRNLHMKCTAGGETRGVNLYGSSNKPALIDRCIIEGFKYGVRTASTAALTVLVTNTEITGCTNGVLSTNGADFTILNSHIHHNSSHGISNSAGIVALIGSLITNNGGNGLDSSGAAGRLVVDRCTFALNSGSGLYTNHWSDDPTTVGNSIFYGNGAWGVLINPKPYWRLMYHCAFGNNTSGDCDFTRMYEQVGLVALTADPFTDAANGDFSLNSAAGGGALCKAAGFPGEFPGGTSTGYLDIGAVQSEGGGTTAAGGSFTFLG